MNHETHALQGYIMHANRRATWWIITHNSRSQGRFNYGPECWQFVGFHGGKKNVRRRMLQSARARGIIK